MSELRTGIALSVLASAILAVGGDSRTQPTRAEVPIPPELQKVSCATLGAFAFNLDAGDRVYACEAAARIKIQIDGKQLSAVAGTNYRTLFGACILRPLLTNVGGVEYVGAARVGEDGTADVTAIKPILPRGSGVAVVEDVLKPGAEYYQLTGSGMSVSVGVAASSANC